MPDDPSFLLPSGFDPFAPDAPLLHVISIMHRDGLPATATDDQMLALVRRLRTVTQQPQSLKAEVTRDSKPRALSVAKKALLDI